MISEFWFTDGVDIVSNVLSLVFPVLFAARYYSKKFTIFVTILTSIIFAISVYLGTYIGFTDLNYVDVPKGTIITVDTTLEDAVDNLELDISLIDYMDMKIAEENYRKNPPKFVSSNFAYS